MRGFGFADHGGPEKLEFVELRDPEPGPDEVRLQVRAAAFNRLDRFTLEGIPGVAVARPHVLGSDAAGIVDQVGPGVTDLEPGVPALLNPGLWDGQCEYCRGGDEALCRNYRIVGEHTQGTMAPYVVVPRRNLHPLPKEIPMESAAAFPLVFQTAWRALKTVAAVRPQETVAVIGAGGGAATAAIQVAKLLGATVVVASRSAEKAERTKALGADSTVLVSESDPLDRGLWRWSGKRGVDVIFDSVGAPTLPLSLRALARGGRLVVIGATAGPVVSLDVRTLFWRQVSIRGSTMAGRKEFDDVLREFVGGRLKPVIDSVHPLERAAEAFARFDQPDLFGKVVVKVAGG